MKLWKKGFVKDFFPPYFISKTHALAKKLKSAVSCPQVVLRQERKEWITGAWGVGKTGSFDNSWLEPMRVSLQVLS